MIDPRIGKPLTTGSPEAAEKYQLAVDCILGSEAGAADMLDQALALDGNLALALAARGLGYPAQRTVLHDVRFRKADWLAVLVATATFAGLVVLRYGLGWGTEPW